MPGLDSEAGVKEWLENLVEFEQKDLYRNFYCAYVFAPEGPLKRRCEARLARLVEVFKLNKQTAAEWARECAQQIAIITKFADAYVDKVA